MRASRTKSTIEITEDAALGGKLCLRQPRRGHRFGHDAILLAAATEAREGEHAIELGAGVGAAGLALATRVGGVRVTLVEVEPELAMLAAENVQRNGLGERVRAVVLDVCASPRAFAAAGLAAETAEHVMMNPPFNDPARQQASPDARRRLAHAAPRATLGRWLRTAAGLLRVNGVLTLIWRADGLSDVLAGLVPDFGSIAVLPVHGKRGAPAIRVLVRAIKNGRGPLVLLPGLMLNDAEGHPTAEAEVVLRGGRALAFNTP
jgi:tRNA1(Val) A37 N6-methylase TrmN6